MRPFPLRTTLTIASVVVSLGLGAVLLARVATLNQSRREANDVYDILDGVERTISRLKDAEGAARGYVISGNPVFLQTTASVESDINTGLNDLAQLTANLPDQRILVDSLAPVVRERLRQADLTTELKRAGHLTPAEAERRVVEGRRLMSESRRLGTHIGSVARQRIEDLDDGDERTILWLMVLIISGTVVSSGLAFATHYVLASTAAAKQRLEGELEHAREHLDAQAETIDELTRELARARRAMA